MAQASSHRDLIVWRKSMDMTVKVYQITKQFPSSEVYGLTSQLRRSAASIPANIAEGSARVTAKDYISFLAIAKGSLRETDTFLILAVRLGYLSQEDCAPALELLSEIGKMLTTMIAGLRDKQSKKQGAGVSL